MPPENELIETEWTDKFGTHFEIRGKDKRGNIHSQVITKDKLWGWTPSWDFVRSQVIASIYKANYD